MGETLKRTISGLILAGTFIFAISWQHMYMLPLYVYVLTCGVLGVAEYYRMAEAKLRMRIPKALGIGSAVLLITIVYLGWQGRYYVPGAPGYVPAIKSFLQLIQLNYALMGGMFFFFLFGLFKLQLLKNTVENSLPLLAIYVFSLVYIPFTFSHVFLLYSLENGLFYVWLVAWATTMSDTAAYFMGKAFGRNKVGFAVSPNKTYEGYILGCLLQMGLVIAFYAIAKTNFVVPAYSYGEIAVFAFVVYLASILGDLVESLLKRDAGVKDSGSLIPGHGGILDLLDALVITVPAAYYYFYIVQEVRQL